MKINRKNREWVFPVLAVSFALSLAGCEVDEEGQGLIGDAFNPAVNGDGVYIPPPEVPPSCFNDRFQQPAAEIGRKIDVLFMTDTSSSLNEERAAVANGIEAFIAALPPEVDYNIGVMLSHGSTSNKVGKLWRKNTSHPLVLKSSELPVEDIKAKLYHRLVNVSSDNSTDGGEIGLYSITRAIQGPELDASRAAGFFREDAALAIVFISDEQDICADYPEGVTPVVDTNNIEPGAKARDCAGITPQSVLDQLKAFQGDRPLLVSAVIYNDLTTVPAGGENEFGYGLHDIVRLANGVTVDLASGDYTQGLGQIGTLATVKLNLHTEFVLSQPASEINPGTIQAWVDGMAVPFNYVAETNAVHLLDAGKGLSFVDISYCGQPQNAMISELCQSGSFVPKSQIKVGISIDMTDNSAPIVVQGFNDLGWNPTIYTDAQLAAGQPQADGVTVLVISRKAIRNPITQDFIDGVIAFVSSGGSIMGEWDGAVVVFNNFLPNGTGNLNQEALMQRLSPGLQLFSGDVTNGSTLVPMETSRTYVTDPFHPVMQGMPSSWLVNIKAAFAVTNFDGDWLHTSAEFVSNGNINNWGSDGTYPAVLTGRCGGGRVMLITMNHFQTMGPASSNDVDTQRLVQNGFSWLTGL